MNWQNVIRSFEGLKNEFLFVHTELDLGEDLQTMFSVLNVCSFRLFYVLKNKQNWCIYQATHFILKHLHRRNL